MHWPPLCLSLQPVGDSPNQPKFIWSRSRMDTTKVSGTLDPRSIRGGTTWNQYERISFYSVQHPCTFLSFWVRS